MEYKTSITSLLPSINTHTYTHTHQCVYDLLACMELFVFPQALSLVEEGVIGNGVSRKMEGMTWYMFAAWLFGLELRPWN